MSEGIYNHLIEYFCMEFHLIATALDLNDCLGSTSTSEEFFEQSRNVLITVVDLDRCSGFSRLILDALCPDQNSDNVAADDVLAGL